ncbi:ParA family protein [Priestia aryabhattai]|uniref:ParA family protein n=1 Tax=Priestia aryabhattai TaxID=412384 RepID=UPI0039A08153
MTKTITFANFKGGVGKTTASVMFSYIMNKQGKKVLLVDLDPQHNATDIIFKTYGIDSKEYNSVFDGIASKDLSQCIYGVDDNLHIIPSDLDLVGFSQYLYSHTKDKRKQSFVLDRLLSEVKGDYDYVFIDVPPTISELTNNAVVASDYVLLILQTHEQSFDASLQFIEYLRDMQEYNSDIDLLGAVAYLVDSRGIVDNEIIQEAENVFKNILFKNKIMNRQRIKRYGRYGITNVDTHDENAIAMFESVVNEFLERVVQVV